MLQDTPNLNVNIFLQEARSIRNYVFLLKSGSRLPKKLFLFASMKAI